MELTQAAAESYHTISHIILNNKMNIKSHKLYFFSPNRLLLVISSTMLSISWLLIDHKNIITLGIYINLLNYVIN